MGMEGNELLERCARKTDAELFAELEVLDADEAKTLAEILAHLAMLYKRRAASGLAYGSLYHYCTQQLGYSEAEAYLRIRVARASLDYPRILTMIANSAINVSAVGRVASYLTADNYRSLLGKAARRSREEIDRLVAGIDPRQEKRPVIRFLSVGSNLPPGVTVDDALFAGVERPGQPPLAANGSASGPSDGAGTAPGSPSTPDAPKEDLAAVLTALREHAPLETPQDAGGNSPMTPPGRVLFNFTASAALLAKFKRAKELLTPKFPRGDPEYIFDAALEALLDRKDPWRRIERREKRRRAAARRR